MVFIVNLRYLYTEHCVQNRNDVEPLKTFCRMNKLQFLCARLFINRLSEIEKQQTELETSFAKTLQIWNDSEKKQPAPVPNIQICQSKNLKI